MGILDAPFNLRRTIRTVTTSTTLVAADAQQVVAGNSSLAMTVTVPENASVALPVGSWVDVIQQGAGFVTVNGTGAVVLTGSVLATTGAGSSIRLLKIATDTWLASPSVTSLTQVVTRTDGGIVLPFGLGTVYPKPVTAGATVEYVDTVLGNDANTGTNPAAPKLTIASALSRATSFNLPVVIYVTAPVTTPVREFNAINYAQPVWIVSKTAGVPFYIYGSTKLTAGWTSDGGGIYHQNFTTDPNSAWITDILDVNGFWSRLVHTAGTQTAPGAGEYGHSSGVLYVHLADASDPGTHTLEVPANAFCIQTRGAGLVTLVDCVLRGTRTNLFIAGGAGTDGRGATVRCVGQYTGSPSGGGPFATATNGVLMACINTLAQRSVNDGFDGSTNAGVFSALVMINCDASYNEDQGASCHQDSRLITVGGRLHHNNDGGVVSVDRTDTTMYGTQVDNNQIGQNINGLDRAGHAAGVDLYASTCTGTLVDCDIAQNVGMGLSAATGAVLTLERTRSGLANGNTVGDDLSV